MILSRRSVLLGGLGIGTVGMAAVTPLAMASRTDGRDGGGGGITGATWMSGINGARSLAALTIPGTHDSCAKHDGRAVRCQETTIREQLDMGVRFLDIRTRHGATLPIHHGQFFLNIHLSQVLDQCRAFLRQNPSEAILMSIKQEKSNESDEDMAWAWRKVTSPYRDILSTGRSVPTLGQARGKVIVVSRNGGVPGIPWSTARVSDTYDIKTSGSWHTNKWPGVTRALDFAAKRGSASQLHVTFTSSWGPLLLPDAANALMEPALKGWLDARPRRAGERLGVVVGDFAKPWKVQQIGARNFGRAHWN